MLGDGGTADPGQRLLTRRVHIKYENLVRPFERAGEFPRESLCARIQVRLEHNDTAVPGDGWVTGRILMRNRPQCRQCGSDLGRMVGVIVEDPYPVGGAHQFEPSAHTFEPGQSVEDLIERSAGLGGGHHGCQGIECHMSAGHCQSHRARLGVPGNLDLGHRASPVLFPVDQASGQPLGRPTAVAQHPHAEGSTAFGQRRGTRIVRTHHQCSPGSDPLNEGIEHRRIGLRTAEEVQMIGFDIGDYRDVGAVLQERAVAFVGLGHENRAAAVVSIGARLAHIAADGEGRIKAAVLQDDDEH